MLQVRCSEKNKVVCCDQPCGKLLSCGKHVGKPTRCFVDLLLALPFQRNALRNVQTTLSRASWLSTSLLARVLPCGRLRSLPSARETPVFLRENVENVRVSRGEWEERFGIFLVWESVWEAAAGMQTRLSIGVS